MRTVDNGSVVVGGGPTETSAARAAVEGGAKTAARHL